jgi:propanol-preferring alcohol dehydrogenase
MKAWQYVADGTPIALNEVAEPIVGLGDVLLEVKAAGICHSDVTYLNGTISSLLAFSPITLGHEIAGIVMQVGEDVTGFAVGDRVAARGAIEGPGTSRDGGFQPRVAVQSDLLVKVPAGVPWDQAAVSTDAGMTSYHAAMVRGQAKQGDKFGIIGMGGLGSLAVQAAVGVGANVYVAESNVELHDYARELGATAVSADITDFEGGAPFDAICDFVGLGTTTADAIDLVKKFGRVVLVGLGQNFGTLNLLKLTTKEVDLLGSQGGSNEDNAKVLLMMAEGKLVCRTVHIGFDEVGDALKRLESGPSSRGRFVVIYD